MLPKIVHFDTVEDRSSRYLGKRIVGEARVSDERDGKYFVQVLSSQTYFVPRGEWLWIPVADCVVKESL
jgi:hypothetical protein